MMKNMYNVFAKKLFGVKYERILRSLIGSLIIFWALSISSIQIQIAPLILYLMTATFTAGVMWQALSSTDNRAYLKNMMMLPFESKKFICAYIGALGCYTLVTKTCILLAVVFSISKMGAAEIIWSILCALAAVLAASCLFYCLKGADVYCFYAEKHIARQRWKAGRRHFIWKYFFRYMADHKNYLVNTVAMCVIACLLPTLFRQMKGLPVLPMGFAILSLNTPLCILLSCDPALEQAVRFLPGQRKHFCIPYCLFIFTSNILADLIFICSWKIQGGEISSETILCAVIFALQSAIGSVLLEWFRPLRHWKIESDLWHHPRKYVVPAVMLLSAVLVGTAPWVICIMGGVLVAECVVFIVI